MNRRRRLLLAGVAGVAGAAGATGAGFAASLPALAAERASGPDWPTTEPQAQGLNADAVADTLRAGLDVPALRALLVARNGVLVAERYYGAATPEALQPINSATKSVCALLVGLALHEGKLQSLDDTVAQLLPEALETEPGSPAGAVTLRQILTGRTGLAFDWALFPQLSRARPLLPYVLSRPAVPVPPPGWSYNDAMVALLAPILQRAQGADLASLAQRQLFAPLGIERFEWQRDAEGQPLAPGGLALRPRDLLKLPALMLEGGRWRGAAPAQVAPEDWVRQCLAPAGPATWQPGAMADVGYGQLWFTGRLAGQRVAWAWGYGGQFALLAPALKLAVATAATSPHPARLQAQTAAVMALVERMVAAVR